MQNQFMKTISFEIEKRLSTVEICNDDIVKFIRSLNQKKTHGHDEMIICMLKLCATSISKPLRILYVTKLIRKTKGFSYKIN